MYVVENKIPIKFLVMILLQFISIMIDRALYLRKNLAGKIIFQFVAVIFIHLWLFFLVPISSERSFNAKVAPVIFYLVKCVYFLLSAYQIRCGYPRRILGNFLTHSFSIFNLGAFKVYMMTPFLFELRALMDWMCTDSSLPLFEWLKMEDIFAKIFELKVSGRRGVFSLTFVFPLFVSHLCSVRDKLTKISRLNVALPKVEWSNVCWPVRLFWSSLLWPGHRWYFFRSAQQL